MARIDILRNTLAVLLALVAVACSGEGNGTAAAADTAPKAEACSLLTKEAVAAAVGKSVGEGRKTNEAGTNKSHQTTCTWESDGAQGASPAERMRTHVAVNLILWSWPNAKRSAHYIESFRKVAKETNEPEPTPIALGDEAILDGTSVHVRQGNASFTVSVQVSGNADQKTAGKAAEALARQVVTKL